MERTSQEIYNEIKVGNYLSENRMRVYEIICRYGAHGKYVSPEREGITALEMRWYAANVFAHSNEEHLPKRLIELVRLGLIEVVCERQCKRGGNLSKAYAITGKIIPTGSIDEPTTTKGQRMQAALSAYKAMFRNVSFKFQQVAPNGIDNDEWMKVEALIKKI